MTKTAITGALVSVRLDRDGGEPMYRQVVSQLRAAIDSGRLPGGVKLPSTRVFAEELGVSRNVVVQVFDTLTEEGLLESRVGAGTFVAQALHARSHTSIVSARADAALAREHRAHADEGACATGRNTAAIAVPRGYPFRSISRRGRALVASASGEFAERPTSFMPDLPDLRQFPIKTWLRLLAETSGRLTGSLLAETTNAGFGPLRQALAQHLNSARGMSCESGQIIITTGSQQSLDLACRMLLDPGDPVWLEEPGYIGARSVIRGNGGAICPVPVDDEGLRLETAVDTYPVPRLIFLSPARQYPLGATLTIARRRALLELARSTGAWIVEDDYDNEFRYEGANLPALQAMDEDARTIHIGTFSKILLPSLRLGYMVVPRDLAEGFARARAVVDRHASLIEQMVLTEFMHRGLFVSHIRRMRVLYRARQRQLVQGLEALLERPLALPGLETGTHLTLPLRTGSNDVAIAQHALECGVIVRPLSPYYATRQKRPGLLLGFAAFDGSELTRGLERLRPLRSELRGRLLQ